jgi:hypothetical protein
MPTKSAARPRAKSPRVTANEQRFLSEIATRAAMASYMGMSFQGNRDLYREMGYPKILKFGNLVQRYYRQDIARAIIDAPVRACWRRKPDVSDPGLDESPFDEAWENLVKRAKVYHYMSRVDRLSSIGKYAVMYLGLNDSAAKQPDQPVETATELMFLSCYSEQNAQIETYETDRNNERYGQPKFYTLLPRAGQSDDNVRVHHSRIIHVAEDLLESEIDGIPRLESVYNLLQNLELVVASSAEMFWRGGFPGLAFKKDPEANIIGGISDDKLQVAIDDYVNKFKRYLQITGLSVQELAQQVADPSGHIDKYVDLIAGATRIPKRILLGTERGELASSQDEENWANRISERQEEHCEAMILRPFVDRMIELTILPAPNEDYAVKWPTSQAQTEKEKADTQKVRAETLALYMGTPGLEDIIPPSIFLRMFTHLTEDQIKEIESVIGRQIDEAREDVKAEQEAKEAAERDAKAAELDAIRPVAGGNGGEPSEGMVPGKGSDAGVPMGKGVPRAVPAGPRW